MKKRIITGLLAAVMAITLTVPAGGIKAEAKWILADHYDLCEKEWESSKTCLCYGYMTADQKQAAYEKTRQIISAAPATAHEKIKHFNDEICNSASFKNDQTMEVGTPYGVLINGKAKCVGYANTFMMLCDLSGIPCMRVGGYSGSTAHTWNIVQLEDGEWYEVDVLANDECNSNDYLLVTTESMKKSGYKRDADCECPIANGTLYAYNKKAVKVGEAKYKVTDTGKVEYTEATKSAKGSITIPDTVTIGSTTYEVTSIAKNAFKGNKKIKKVTIGKNVETIGSGAFSNCPNLKSVDMSKCKVTYLSKNLFKGSKKLSKLSLNGDKVTSVGKNALKNIFPKCKVTISGTDTNAGLVKSLKKQGGKKCKYNIK